MSKLKSLVREAIEEIKPYVPGKPIEEVERELGITNVIKLASNENPLGPSPEAVEAMRNMAEKVHMYPDGNCYYLKRRLASMFGLTKNNFIIGNGSDEILKLIAETFIKEGDEAIIANPTFSEYTFATQLMGGKCVYVDLKDFRYDLPAMADRITDRTKLIFVCNPNNPTGTIVTASEVEDFMRRVPEEVIVVFDEAYWEYVTSEDYPDTLEYVKKGKKNVIILRTFSKVYGLAGLRIGYGMANSELIEWINRAREPFNVNSIAQAAALAALEDQVHVRKSININNESKEWLYRKLEEIGLSYVPTEANFMLINVKHDSRQVFQKLLERGVIVRTGDIFGLDQYIRVTIGTLNQNERFIEALQEVLKELEQ
ncbi:histidinol-phosphate transaminase [Calderihabitans maritimus]|uniref:Histidinol-phosphate aminotransferase n=1 Tax=Calderihabitans maritimus TaxID=1246530 RepID=A0A1Z5HP07_9FIRM|nr:histidinol-phosphate transaminase [Calderihabitans maritimus]GAW91266.1 histidinol phosphate aminotransferase [Calderihabitans maritimus]